MSGGKSSTTTTTTQEVRSETNQADASGVISGNVLQGEITYQDEFGDNVLEAFTQLIELSGKSVDVAKEAGGAAIQAVAQRRAEQENPSLSSVTAIMPVLIIGAIGLVIYYARKK